MSEKQSVEVALNVLGYREDDEWVALVLEMDLRGYGKTLKEAILQLRDVVSAHIEFAASKGEPHLLWFDAEPRFWKMFEAAKRAGIERRAFGRAQESDLDFEAAGITVPPAHLAAEHFRTASLEA